MENQKAVDNLVKTAFNSGVPQDQLENFLGRGYVPLHWQMKFHAAARQADKEGQATEIGCGGARGPGKSHAVFAQVTLDDCMRVPNLKGLFLRQTGQAAKESFEDLIGKVLSGRVKYNYRSQPASITLENKSKIILGGFRDERDIDQYVGIEYDLIAIEELNQLTENKVEKLKGSLRTSKTNWRPRVYTSFNPGGRGHLYVKGKYVDPYFQKNEKGTIFVPSTYKDNPHLNVEYTDYLEALSGNLGKAWREGNFDIFEGQYFGEWNPARHVITPFTIPEHWKKYRAYDHGRSAPACCHWYAVDEFGRVFVYRELYKAGLNVDELGEEISRLSEGEHYEFSVADPSIFANHGFVDKAGGQTIAEGFARHGVMFSPASNRRVDGWSIMHQYLDCKNTDPKLVYFNTCFDTIRTLPALIHDDKKPEDLDTTGEDHCFIGDTLVDTIRGKKKIKDLVGQEIYVNTIQGFKKCRSIRKTRKAKVWKVLLINGKEIICTPDHKFLTNNGWKELQNIDIRYDYLIQLDICIKLYLKLFKNLTMKGIIFVVNIFKGMVKDFILKFGTGTMEIFQKAFTFIIRIITGQTIELKTYNYYQPISIYPYTLKHQNTEKKQERILLNMLNQKLLNGINQRKVENGIVNTQKNKQRNGYMLKRIVLSVIRNMKHLSSLLIGQNTAIKIVKLQPYGEEDVYDLTVPNVEHFTINGGIVVHNCADTDRYFLVALHETKAQKPKNEVELKLDELKKVSGIEPANLNEFYYNK